MQILLCQISTNLINPPKNDIASRYYNKIWEARKDNGYWKSLHYWELPNWVAIMKYNLPHARFTVVEDIDRFLELINQNHYDLICFSVLEANKNIVRQIVDGHTGRSTFILGGYIDFNYFRGRGNIEVYHSIPQFIYRLGQDYKPGYNYSDFDGNLCIPRLVMSQGCRNRCAFCTEAKPLIETPRAEIENQVESFRPLKFKLVYLNDKTFGQAKNHIRLPELGARIQEYNPDFDGFIIQTTTTQFVKMPDQFLLDSKIHFVELGVESFNDDILRKYRKPSSVKKIIEASNKLRGLPILLVPDIIVGMPEETLETYHNTLEYVMDHQDVISHLNAYNLSVYKDSEISQWLTINENGDCNELAVHKSFHADPTAHQWFHGAILEVGLNLLDRPIK